MFYIGVPPKEGNIIRASISIPFHNLVRSLTKIHSLNVLQINTKAADDIEGKIQLLSVYFDE